MDGASTPPPRLAVLVIDDGPDNRLLLRALLERGGYRPVLADSGEAGLACFERETPALILLDLRMPRLNGWDLAARLRANDRLRSVPIVVVAAHLAIAEEAAAIGARAWLHKPVSIDHLLSVVRGLFGEPRGEAAL